MTTNPTPQPFAEWMHEHRGGAFHGELSEKLAALTAAVVNTQKTGTLTIKVKVKATGHQVSFVDTVSADVPEHDKELSLFFFDEETGAVSKDDPRQLKIDGLRRLPRRHPDADADAV
jgi:hypothetical protein